ncbi:MAG: response regulator, partial [Gemmatimonadaceae bacterium]
MPLTRAPQAERPARILIVDDQEANTRLLGRILEKAGYEEVASTNDSTQAVAIQARFRPDLILLDVHMKEMDGFKVLEDIIAHSARGEHIPVIMITADDSAETKRRALALGAKDFVGKPFDSAEVLLRIRNHLETRFLHHRLRDQNVQLELMVT